MNIVLFTALNEFTIKKKIKTNKLKCNRVVSVLNVAQGVASSCLSTVSTG